MATWTVRQPGQEIQAREQGKPQGSPPGKSLAEHLEELLRQTEFNGKPMPNGDTVARHIAKVMIAKALRGDYRFCKEILDRVDGKVPTHIDLTSLSDEDLIAQAKQILGAVDGDGRPGRARAGKKRTARNAESREDVAKSPARIP